MFSPTGDRLRVMDLMRKFDTLGLPVEPRLKRLENDLEDVTAAPPELKDVDDYIMNLIDALRHISITANRSETQTRRLRWIKARADSAIQDNDDWKEADFPKNKKGRRRTHDTNG